MEMNLRRAQKSDMEFLFNLRNEDSVRAASWSTDRVEMSAHQAWLDSSLQNPKRILYIIEVDGKSAGQVRFDIDDGGKTVEISTSVSGGFQGKGIGSSSLRAADKILFENFPDIDKIFAHIKADNPASINAFLKAGYANQGKVDYEWHECIEMVSTR